MSDFIIRLMPYKNMFILLFSVLFVLLIACIIYDVVMSSFRRRDLMQYLNMPVEANGYFCNEVDKCCRHFADSMALRHKGADKDLFYEKLSGKIKPMLLEHRQVPHSSFGENYFAPQFVDFVQDKYKDYKVKDFPKLAREYVRHMRKDAPSVNHVDAEFERRLAEEVVDRVLTTEAARIAQEKRVQDAVAKAVLEITPEHELVESLDHEKHEKDILYKKLIKSSYNCAVRDIKLKDNRGLNPESGELMKQGAYDKLCGLRIYTPAKIKSMMGTEEAVEFDCSGCYIIFNTFNNMYFVGQSDSMFSRVYELLGSFGMPGCAALRKDIGDGHLVLVKFVRPSDVGYNNIMRLQRDLILSYDCRQGKGYNK